MKTLLAIFMFVATAINAPTVCAHALGAVSETPAHHHAAMTEGAAHHQHNAHSDASGEKKHGDCDPGCNGGAGCEGCAVVAAALLVETAESAKPGLSFLALTSLVSAMSATYTDDPPPPRTR